MTETTHLTDAQLSAMLDGELKGDALWRAEQHLESCEACRDGLAALSARDAALGTALSNEPGDAYFASFADRVVGRIAAVEASGANPERAARDAERRPFPRAWWESPRRLAMVGGVAMLIAGAGVVLMTAREAPMPVSERSRAFERKALETETAPPAATEPAEGEKTGPALGIGPAAGTVAGTSRAEKDALAKKERAAAARAPATPPPAAPLATSPAAGTRMSEVPRGGAEPRARSTPSRSNFAPAPKPEAQTGATTAEKVRQLKRAALAPSTAKTSEARSLATQESPAAGAPTAAMDQVVRRDLSGMRCGTVRDDRGRPLAGVEVTAIDVARSTTTGADGRFCLELSPGEHQLQLLALGFRAARVSMRAGGGDLVATLTPVEVLGGAARTSRSEDRDGVRAFAGAPASAITSISGGDAALRAFPGFLRAVAEEAARVQGDAATTSGPAGYDDAAVAWERVLARASGGAPEVEIRARIAECRYLAWRRARDARHSSAAVEALASFIGRVPAGDRQNLAARWLDQVRAR